MEYFSTIVNGREVYVSNVIIIQDNITSKTENTVMVVDAEDGEDFLTGEVLFEATFENPDDADVFYELIKRNQLTSIG